MQVEGEDSASKEPQAKVSTSGPRVSRRESYRSSKGFKVKQTPTTLFTARGESEYQNNILRFTFLFRKLTKSHFL